MAIKLNIKPDYFNHKYVPYVNKDARFADNFKKFADKFFRYEKMHVSSRITIPNEAR
ncbi:hypothetical protein [Neobacillus sp. 114]|uniref:hypothetical protein n=1 Tax=Neobacillus sp. 114 TaxID=3048535 RepID=UPI0024C3D939|nr:hypothetical protein [Neobacillus sp. 114]